MMSSRLAPSALVLALLLAGCATPKPPATDRLAQYDLGPVDVAPVPDTPPDTPPDRRAGSAGPFARPAAPSAGADPLPPLKIVAVTAPSALDSDQMIYRLVYADPRQARRYAGSRWSATPAQLLTDRLRNVLSRQARILDGGDPERGAPMLKVALLDFSQRFDAPGAGRGVVAVRASLLRDGQVLAQRDFGATAPSATADAAGGAAAIAAAADAVARDIGAWLGAWRAPSPPMPPSPSTPSTPLAPLAPAAAQRGQ
ncbi:ABC-type transport auxiliary lipoprotein family protein [Robbsia sp. Bb-Pol-6]|uniref:ABC-type transport auxiliary lipoprotein family protein n=1 Tax=Robbsia betulipollinis TaxID=2981849 RepID=A0ABT3ZS95_9BURK|nr:ABC-type transport auxiliary lipoprotein family protein [Robbsia betulipollinis]MCY0389085.1 ABC-type transport auxiliary lipoprotein family protein [Robbsia betulipollinis]